MDFPLRKSGGGSISSLGLSLSLAAAAAGLVYIVFGGGRDVKKTNKRRPQGLRNPGNSCYVNAVLQALASNAHFIQWIQNKDSSLVNALKSLFKQLNREEEPLGSSSGLLDPGPLISSLRSHGWVLDNNEQDANELLNVIFTTLEEELKQKQQNQSCTSFYKDILQEVEEEEEENIPELETVVKPTRGHKRRNSGVFVRSASEELSFESVQYQIAIDEIPFNGTLTNKLIYGQNKVSNPVSSHSFHNITLNLPSRLFQGTNLVNLLRMFTAKEVIQNENRTVTKQQRFGKLPDCLCFHIQRTAFDGGVPSKRNDFVSFSQVLNMSEFAYNTKNDFVVSPKDEYKLKSVVEHLGHINSGHYITYRRGPIATNRHNRWYLTSDDHIEEVDLNRVLKANPYMLFYEKE